MSKDIKDKTIKRKITITPNQVEMAKKLSKDKFGKENVSKALVESLMECYKVHYGL